MSDAGKAPTGRDFDTNPPVPVTEYRETVRRVNPGYELAFTLVHAYLRALQQPHLLLLVVGAGGGAEVATFGPANPGWQLTGVDPSEQMLSLARTQAEALGIAERVTLLQGTVDAVPDAPAFDAATCIYVLHFLPDSAAKLALFQGIARRLKTGAPLLLVSPVADARSRMESYLDPWQAYGELMGMPPARMAAILADIQSRPMGLSEAEQTALLQEAGFREVTRFFSALAVGGWVAR